MVKVKAYYVDEHYVYGDSFNHPMVKVKGIKGFVEAALQGCFNHPMVKVKDIYERKF